MRTDFEELGLSRGRLAPADRRWLLTIDFEAFDAASLAPWLEAMRAWARESARHGLEFVVFLATENVVQLRAADPDAYRRFCAAAAEMTAAGAEWHPHCHYVFDPNTGRRPAQAPSARVLAGYGKRASLFHDAVYVNGADLADWLRTVRGLHDRFLADAGIAAPAQAAFRAGGWDYGSSRDDLSRYVEAVAGAGFAFDSSAVVGADWRVGARFGENAFALAPGLAEVAPGAGTDCGSRLLSRRTARSLRDILRQPGLWARPLRRGVLVTVLHFDHLFTARRDRPAEIVRGHMRFLSGLGRVLRLTSAGFGDLRLVPQGVDGRGR